MWLARLGRVRSVALRLLSLVAVFGLLGACGSEVSTPRSSAGKPGWSTSMAGFEGRAGALRLRASEQGRFELRAGDAPAPNRLAFDTTGIVRGDWREQLGATVSATDGVLEWARGQVREKLTLLERGAEQTWELDAAPPGEGAMTIHVTVTGGTLVRSDERGFVFAAPGLSVRYGNATWVDATGRRTALGSRFDNGQILITVPHELLVATSYPAILDPIISPEQDIDGTELTGRRETNHPEAAFCGGRYLAAWADYGSRVFAARVDAGGTVLDPGGILLAPASDQSTYRMSVGCVGDVFGVVWYRYPSGSLGSPSAVELVRVTADGAVLDSPPIQLPLSGYYVLSADATNLVYLHVSDQSLRATRIATTGQVLDEPAIQVATAVGFASEIRAVFADGGIHAFWQANDGHYMARLEADGSVTTPSDGKLLFGEGDESLTSVAFDGQSFLATHSARAGTVPEVALQDVYAYRFNIAGDLLTPSLPVYVAPDGQRAHDAGRIQNGFVVAYSDGGGYLGDEAYVISVSSDGQPLGPAVSLGQAGLSSLTSGDTGSLVLYYGGAGQMLSASGAPVGGVFQVANAEQEQTTPHAAALPDQYLVTWEASIRRPISAARVGQSGSVLDSSHIEFPAERPFDYDAHVASDGVDYMVLYHESDGIGNANANVRLQRVSAQGALVGAVQVVATNADYWSHDLAYDGQGFVTVWKTRDGTIHRSRYSKATNGWEPSVALTASGTSADVGANSASELAVWLESGRIRGRFAYRDATPAKTQFLTAAGSSASDPEVVSDGTNYLVAWRTTTPASLRVQRWSAAGVAIDPAPLSLDASHADYQAPSATFDGARYLVLWGGSSGNSYVVKASELSGAGLQPALTLRSGLWPEENYTVVSPRVAIASAGAERSLALFSSLQVDPPYGNRRIRARFIDYNAATPCSSGGQCASGFCVDGVCCDKACGNSNDGDCQACSVAAGAAKNGVCGPALPSTVCRAGAGSCDIEESCDGKSLTCPADARKSGTAVCRPSSGACDAPEFCAGGIGCPVDGYQPSSTLCRAARGACDEKEYCSGNSKSCPVDGRRGAGQVCRASLGECDLAEVCDGNSIDCAVDSVAPPNTPCRSAAGVCDVAETCDGSSGACPTDSFASHTTICRAATAACDAEETCSGQSPICPDDALAAADHVCRPSAGACDVPESCTGDAADCPGDLLAAAGSQCREAQGACDQSEICSGDVAECPSDALLAAGTTCRDIAGPCDVAEQCTGSAHCPVDAFSPDGASCGDAAAACSGPATCMAGACVAAEAPECDDDDACTLDACFEPGGCQHSPIADCAPSVGGGPTDENRAGEAGSESTSGGLAGANFGGASHSETGGATVSPAKNSGGCGCRVVPPTPPRWPATAVLALLVGLVRRRASRARRQCEETSRTRGRARACRR